jgi:hypothetical protein
MLRTYNWVIVGLNPGIGYGLVWPIVSIYIWNRKKKERYPNRVNLKYFQSLLYTDYYIEPELTGWHWADEYHLNITTISSQTQTLNYLISPNCLFMPKGFCISCYCIQKTTLKSLMLINLSFSVKIDVIIERKIF